MLHVCTEHLLLKTSLKDMMCYFFKFNHILQYSNILQSTQMTHIVASLCTLYGKFDTIYVTVQAKTSLVHISDFAQLMNYKIC